MPYVEVEPELFLEHNGVQIFHVYKDGLAPWDYWFTTDPDTADECHSHGHGGHFDARMFAARWSATPNVAQWEDFWKPRFKSEDDAIKALIRSAIEGGFVRAHQ